MTTSWDPLSDRAIITLTWDTYLGSTPGMNRGELLFRRDALYPLDLEPGAEIEVHFNDYPVLVGTIREITSSYVRFFVPAWVED